MDMKPFSEQTAEQIAQIFFIKLRYYYPGGNNAILDPPHPQGGPPQPLEKKPAEKDIWWSKMELCSTS